MSKKKNTGKKPQITAKCVFCDRPGVDHQHIWPKWVRKLIGSDVARIESVMVGGTMEAPTYDHRPFQGGVHTKSARKVCPTCNRGWMRDIELAAESDGTKLIKGEPVDLDKDSQAKLASFIAQSALMIDLTGKNHNKFSKRDFEYFYTHKIPPPHWYVGTGYFFGPKDAFAADYSPQALVTGDKRVIVHSVSTILGRLFTSVQALGPNAPNETVLWPVHVNAPQLAPVAPHLTHTVRFPPHTFFNITGGFVPDGGLARELSLRFPRHAAAEISSAHDRARRARGVT